MRILLVEDSLPLRTSVKVGLEHLHYAVDAVDNGIDALRYAESQVYDLLVLDLMLPGMHGLEVLREMRARGNQSHVLILSALADTDDRVRGLQLGADDYLIKPFAFRELSARIEALLRRHSGVKQPTLSVADLELDTVAREARHAGRSLSLSSKEFAVLEALLRHRGQVLSRAQLICSSHDYQNEVSDNAIEVLISGLRKKLRQAGAGRLIETRRGFGYLVR